MQGINENLVRSVVEEVLSRLGGSAGASLNGRYGVFTDVDEAVKAARAAYEELARRTRAERKKILDQIRRICIENSVEFGTKELEETKIGRLEHKIDKILNVGYNAQGVEALTSEVFSGDHGLTVIEAKRSPSRGFGCSTRRSTRITASTI